MPACFGAAIVNYGGAGVQSSQVSGVTHFAFQDAMTTNRTLASSGGSFDRIGVVSSDQYGGAQGNAVYGTAGRTAEGTTKATFTLNTPSSYFGFWWSAADAENVVTFYDGKNVVMTLTTADLQNALGGCSAGNAYCGNPNNGLDNGELFAYVNIYGTGTTKFTSVEFANTMRTGFEFDNLAFGTASVPEPTTLGLAAGALVGLGALVARRRNTKA